MADALSDLAIVPITSSDTNYFLRKVTGLKIDKNYSFKFQWVYEDGSLSDWSPGYQTYTPAESVPSSPTATVPSTNASYIPVTLPTFPTNAKRVDIYIVGGAYGTGKVADSFLQAGTKSISVGAGTYQVSLITVSPSGINGTPSNTFTITITDPTANIQSPAASVTPSVPTVSSVLGAIQVSWDGKTSTGASQPYGFNAAKVYVGTSAGFTPSSSNQVDVLNFANGQNTLNIGLGTLVDGVALAHGIDYYIKIATTNGTDTSTAVSATGNPVRVGQVQNGSLVTITADKIDTGTLSSGSTITVGSTSGKHVKLSGTGDPLTIYGSGGVSNPVLSYNGAKLTIVGDGAFTGSITGSSGTFGPVTIGTTGISSTNFSIANDGTASFNGILTASGGAIGGWYINASILRSSSSSSATPRIELDPLTPQIILAGNTGSITMSPQNGIVGPNVTIAGNTGPGFSLSPNGTAVLRGSIYADTGIFSGNVSGATISTSRLTSPQGTFSIDTYSSYDQIQWTVGGSSSRLGFVASGMVWDGPGSNGFQMTTAGNTVIYSSGNTISLSTGTQQSASYVSGGASGQNTFIVNSVSSLSVGKVLVSGTGQQAGNTITAINAGTNQVTMSNNFTQQASGTYVFTGPTISSSGGGVFLKSSNSPTGLGLRNIVGIPSGNLATYGISNGSTVDQTYYVFYNGDVIFSY